MDKNKEAFDEAIRTMIESFEKENINIFEEYEKIKNKQSNLSRAKRDAIIAIVQLKENYNYDVIK